MKFNYIILSLGVTLALGSCKNDKKIPETIEETKEVITEKELEPVVKKVIVPLDAKSDSKASGTVIFEENEGVVKMTAVISGLSEGTHAIHIHKTGDCSSTDGKSAGGHWNPTAQPHGKWGVAEGYHKGDIGNFETDENGNGTISKTTDEWCIGCEDATKNVVGKGIIVHQGVDDFTSQPSGAAGARVACGGIIK